VTPCPICGRRYLGVYNKKKCIIEAVGIKSHPVLNFIKTVLQAVSRGLFVPAQRKPESTNSA